MLAFICYTSVIDSNASTKGKTKMSEQARYSLEIKVWNGKRIYLTGVCTNLDRVDANTRRAHARGYDYGFLALDVDGSGMVEGWELCGAKHDIERSGFVNVGSNFSLWAEQIIEAQGFVFSPDFEKEVA